MNVIFHPCYFSITEWLSALYGAGVTPYGKKYEIIKISPGVEIHMDPSNKYFWAWGVKPQVQKCYGRAYIRFEEPNVVYNTSRKEVYVCADESLIKVAKKIQPYKGQ